jgi:hypothetical protein
MKTLGGLAPPKLQKKFGFEPECAVAMAKEPAAKSHSPDN